MWLAQELLDAEPGTHITSGGLGAMGYGVPAAMGAALGRPDHPTWAVVGDGGFQMTLQELATIAQEQLPIRIAVINNASLGMVRQWQEIVFDERYVASALSGPDFSRLAEAYGIAARSVRSAAELTEALEFARDYPGPFLIDVRVPTEDNVFPMLTPGTALDEMITESPRPAARGC
jgi:acetolactate synthase-1/2/3 large subunit